MIKVLTVGKNTLALKGVHAKLSLLESDYDQVQFTVAKPGAVSSTLTSDNDILIYDAENMSPLMELLMQEVKKTGFTGPILILAKRPPGADLSGFKKFKNVHLLEKPYDNNQLLGVVKNCIENKGVGARRDQRFDVKESAVLETYSSDFKVDALINNISKSGVRVEGNLEGLQKGDLLRLHFNFDQIQKERVVSARVVWRSSPDDVAGQAGLEFVSQQAVYQHLLKSAIA